MKSLKAKDKPIDIDQLSMYVVDGDLVSVGEVLDKIIRAGAMNQYVLNLLINALVIASKNGNLSIVQRLLVFPEVKQNVTANNNEAFRSAVSNGHQPVVKIFLQFPAVISMAANNNNAVVSAAEGGHLDVLNTLLVYPAFQRMIAAENCEALRKAAKKNHLDVVKTLVIHWPPEDRYKITTPITINEETLTNLIINECALYLYNLILLSTSKSGTTLHYDLVREAFPKMPISIYSQFFNGANNLSNDIILAFYDKDLPLYQRCHKALNSLMFDKRKKVMFLRIIENYRTLDNTAKKSLYTEFTAAFDDFIANFDTFDKKLNATNQNTRNEILTIAEQFATEQGKRLPTKLGFLRILNNAVEAKDAKSAKISRNHPRM